MPPLTVKVDFRCPHNNHPSPTQFLEGFQPVDVHWYPRICDLAVFGHIETCSSFVQGLSEMTGGLRGLRCLELYASYGRIP